MLRAPPLYEQHLSVCTPPKCRRKAQVCAQGASVRAPPKRRHKEQVCAQRPQPTACAYLKLPKPTQTHKPLNICLSKNSVAPSVLSGHFGPPGGNFSPRTFQAPVFLGAFQGELPDGESRRRRSALKF
jgi:hypothetical protein